MRQISATARLVAALTFAAVLAAATPGQTAGLVTTTTDKYGVSHIVSMSLAA